MQQTNSINNIQDLNIKSEILPLFDYSHNMFTKEKILDMLQKPLGSTEEIISRQNILKGFIASNQVLKNYSYTTLYFNEVYNFLSDPKVEDFSENKMQFRFFTSKTDKSIYRSKLNQLILFLHKLEINCFSKLDLSAFPEPYTENIRRIISFLSCFSLNEYENLVKYYQLKDTHIMNLSHIISDLNQRGQISVFWEDLFLFEAYHSISVSIIKNNFTFPGFTKKGINLSEFYHPVLKNAVKNDFKTSTNVIVLNGPNMSGKSTFLKAIGLCIYFGHLGIGIPASAGEIPFCTDFSIEINRRDDILNGYSHFMTEIINLKRVVEKASGGNKCFAVFDELFSGTNVEDAFEICKTTINGLSKFNTSYFFISTHIQELKSITNPLISTYHIDCELLNNKPTFTYKLREGWSDIKIGRILFDREGLNQLLG